MDNNEMKLLIDAFKGYRDLLSPIQSNLSDFMDTYELMREDIDKLNSAFGGDVKANLEKIYRNLSSQAEKATDLSSRIDRFITVADKYTGDIARLADAFSRAEEKLKAINELENKAEVEIDKLSVVLEEKKRSYNVKELQKTIDNYNENVKRVADFINKDVAGVMTDNASKLDKVKSGHQEILKAVRDESAGVDKLVATFTTTNDLLRKVAEKGDVNEEYLYDILDKWANDRKIKVRKK